MRILVTLISFVISASTVQSCKLAVYEKTGKDNSSSAQPLPFGPPGPGSDSFCPDPVPPGTFCSGMLRVDWTPTQPKVGETVTFRGYCGSDANSGWNIDWRFDDGSTNKTSHMTPEAAKAFLRSGENIVEVNCVDAFSQNHTGTFGINVLGSNDSVNPNQNQNQSQN